MVCSFAYILRSSIYIVISPSYSIEHIRNASTKLDNCASSSEGAAKGRVNILISPKPCTDRYIEWV